MSSGWVGRTLVILLLAGANLFAQTPNPPAGENSQPVTTPEVFTIPSGEALQLELVTPLNSRTARKGDRADFTLANEVLAGGQVAIPRGTTVRATITKAKRAGTLKKPQIELQFDEIVLLDGRPRPLSAAVTRAPWARPQGEHGGAGRVARSAGRNAATGAILGTILGGGRGAVQGSVAGAAAGTIMVLMQHGPDLDFPRGMPFEVELTQPLSFPVQAATPREVAKSSTSSDAGPLMGRHEIPTDDSPPQLTRHEASKEPDQPPSTSNSPTDSNTVAANRTPPPTTKEPARPLTSVRGGAASSGYEMKVDVELVVVEATVRDRSGMIVDDLKREDFHVFEDGVEQQITHFSRDELPLAVALVVDRSGSMAPVLQELRLAAYDTLSQLKPEDEVALFAFASKAERLEDLTTDRQRIADRIESISVGGGTNITDALYEAAMYLGRAAPHSRHAIVLVSDNEGTVAGFTGNGEVIRAGLETETSVYSIKVNSGTLPRVMTMGMPSIGTGSVAKIAKQTGGEVIDARGASSVASAMATVISRLKQRYSLGYVSSNHRRDGAFRKIEILVKNDQPKAKPTYVVYARRGYYARTEHVAQKTP